MQLKILGIIGIISVDVRQAGLRRREDDERTKEESGILLDHEWLPELGKVAFIKYFFNRQTPYFHKHLISFSFNLLCFKMSHNASQNIQNSKFFSQNL